MTRGIFVLLMALAAAPEPVAYQDLPATTSRPFRVDRRQFAACAFDYLTPKAGPHETPALKMYVNDIARSGLNNRTRRMRAGAMIVKEKWSDENATQPLAYAAMIKRAPGYDKQHGDWEYVYAELDGKKRIERGRVASCIACHKGAAEGDYLFRRHLQLKNQAPDANPQTVPSSK